MSSEGKTPLKRDVETGMKRIIIEMDEEKNTIGVKVEELEDAEDFCYMMAVGCGLSVSIAGMEKEGVEEFIEMIANAVRKAKKEDWEAKYEVKEEQEGQD